MPIVLLPNFPLQPRPFRHKQPPQQAVFRAAANIRKLGLLLWREVWHLLRRSPPGESRLTPGVIDVNCLRPV